FSRSANFASAFRSDPCSSTARWYSGPNLCRRSAVVLLRFRTYSQASTAMIRITTAASTISFGSSRFRFIDTSLHQECPQNQICSRSSLCRQNLVNRQYQTLGFGNLFRIDRFVNRCSMASRRKCVRSAEEESEWLNSQADAKRPNGGLRLPKAIRRYSGGFFMSNQARLARYRGSLFHAGQGLQDSELLTWYNAIEVVTTFSSFRFPELSQSI